MGQGGCSENFCGTAASPENQRDSGENHKQDAHATIGNRLFNSPADPFSFPEFRSGFLRQAAFPSALALFGGSMLNKPSMEGLSCRGSVTFSA